MPVNDAIILAGGVGSRMLPASLYSPKEMLPLVDTPIINHIIWEARRAGVKRVHLVLSEIKKEILESFLAADESRFEGIRNDLPRDSLRLGGENLEVELYLQKEARGVGDAISVAIGATEGPFLVLLGDMLIMQSHNPPSLSPEENASDASLKMIEDYRKNGLPCVGVIEVEPSQVTKYGVVSVSDQKVKSIVEKPEMSVAPSSLVLCGRYLFPENTQELLDACTYEEYGELQSIHMLNRIISETGLSYVEMENMVMYDSGDPLTWLKSQVDYALRREDMARSFSKWLEDRLAEN